jgi:hypothetical protein
MSPVANCHLHGNTQFHPSAFVLCPALEYEPARISGKGNGPGKGLTKTPSACTAATRSGVCGEL